MRTFLLYAAVVLIWGSTWIAIPFQIDGVAAEMSVGYRFAIAGVLLYGFALASGRQIALPTSAWLFVVLQGVLLFCLNYFLVYYGTAYITTGLVAVAFSSVVIFNAIFEPLFFRIRFEPRVLIAAITGMTGIALVFWPEVSAISFNDDSITGLLLVIAAAVIGSLGNMTAVVNTRPSMPVVAVNAHSMLIGGLLSIAIGLALGRELNIATTTPYVASLAYLAVFGSAIAFGCFLALIRRIGAARAAYSAVAVPIVALAISTLVEGYEWTATAAIGIILILVGNGLIIGRSKKIISKTES